MDIRLDSVAVDIGRVRIVRGVTFAVPEGSIAGLVGPNGSGKSTLLRTLYRHLRPADGQVVVSGQDLWKLKARENSRRIAAVPQERPTDFDFTTREMVAMGCLPHTGPFPVTPRESEKRIDDAMRQVGLEELAHRSFATLSGGERQRVLVARALVQATPILVLDEPTNHLDIRHQLDLLELLRTLRLTTVMAIHDLNLAAAYCESIHVMNEGQLVASGRTRDVLTSELVAEVFLVDCTCELDVDGTLRLSFKPRQHKSLLA